jgi:3-hydroxyisobutyrate dehydrogenase-like beta-hydroxyacid dehydrogenase
MSRRTRKNVGVIGLGIIGSRVSANLRKKGFHVFVWNRTPRPVPNFLGAPAEIVQLCDYVQIFVSDDDALLGVVQQLIPALAPRHIIIAHSTVAPHSMRAAAEIVERRGARFIEAPFTGSKTAAENGELVFYVAGDDAALGEARPILEASSKEIIEIGEIGQATAIKIATNMITAATVQAAAEALALIQTVGLPLEKFIEAMRSNASYSATLAMKLPKMIEGNFEPHFSVQHMLKDMQIANRLALFNHLDLGVTLAARDRLLEQMQQGHGEDDYSAIARRYFPELFRPVREEPVLELFEEHVSPEPLASEHSETEVPPPDQSSSFAPMAPELQVQDLEDNTNMIVPASERPAVAVASEETTPETESSEVAIASEETTPEMESSKDAPVEPDASVSPQQPPEEETPPRRNFLSRWLHRGESQY